MKKPMNKKLYIALLCVFGAIFVASAFMLVKYAIGSAANADRNNQLASVYSRPTGTRLPPATTTLTPSIPEPTTTAPSIPLPSFPVTTAPVVTAPPTTTQPPAPVMLPGMDVLYAQNSHTVGVIDIPGVLPHSYPVVQPPNSGAWRDYYLDHDFDRNESKWGTIYAREVSDVFKPSDNVTLYGHAMADGSMFGTLCYYETKSFYEGHKLIYFDTLYETHTYEIFAVFVTSGTYGVGYAYHLFDDALNADDFNEHVAMCKKLSFYDTGITPTYGDKLLTLSTCYYNAGFANARLVVIARRID